VTRGEPSVDRVDTVDPQDRGRAVATLELAFAADPVMRWFWPRADVYRTFFSRFVAAAADRSFELGAAHWLDNGVAVALWLPPGRGADEQRLVEVILESVDAAILTDLSAFADGIRELHPEYEHWYLPFTGVDPPAQGRGLGTILLRHALTTCDRDGLPAYLEASTARSRALYARLGFEELGAIQVGSSPTVWPMLRVPRKEQVL
jgi:GNAT superfamily N-acetyltransferase